MIGSEGWELKQGIGFIKGYSWGTMTYRVAGEYDEAEGKYELGEYAVEYLKRVNRNLRTYVGIEGSQDEIELITELQFHVNDHVFFKFNNAFGVTSKATDWAPEVGVVFVFPPKK